MFRGKFLIIKFSLSWKTVELGNGKFHGRIHSLYYTQRGIELLSIFRLRKFNKRQV